MRESERRAWRAGYADGLEDGRNHSLARVARVLSRCAGQTQRPSTIARAIAAEFATDPLPIKPFRRQFNRDEFMRIAGGRHEPNRRRDARP